MRCPCRYIGWGGTSVADAVSTGWVRVPSTTRVHVCLPLNVFISVAEISNGNIMTAIKKCLEQNGDMLRDKQTNQKDSPWQYLG